MNAAQKKSLSLEDVLAEISMLPAAPDATRLREWINKYPEFAAEIIDFATDWVEMEATHVPHEVTQDEVDTVVSRTMSRVQQMLFEGKKSAKLTDLFVDIEASGHDADSFQRTVGIEHSILECLARRLIRPASIPRRLISSMAQVLNRSLDEVRDFLWLPPAPAAAYKSRKKPDVSQVDFVTILEHAELPAAEKERWRSEEPDGNQRG